MKEIKGNIFDIGSNGGVDCICITTNGIVGATGLATMGAGTAGEAARRWPNIRACLGRLLNKHGNRVFMMGATLKDGSFVDPRIDKFDSKDVACFVASFPTKNDWRNPSRIDLIKTSTEQMVELADAYKIKSVAMSRPGCSNGGLKWVDVKQIIEPMLDDRFVIVSFAHEE